MPQTKQVPIWNSGRTFCLAVAGLTVGLQFVWTMPAMLLRGGGAGFVVVYLLALLLFAAPVLAVEIWLGREGRADPIGAVIKLQRSAGLSRFWRVLGPLSTLVSVMVAAYVGVLGGWALVYGIESVNEAFLAQSPEYTVEKATGLLRNAENMVPWFSIFLLAASVVSAFGVNVGIGFALRLLMPFALLILLILLAHLQSIGALATLQSQAGLLELDYLAISAETGWAAVSLAFFSLSVGLGGTLACSAYIPKHVRIPRAVLGIVGITLLFAALLATLVMAVLLYSNIEVTDGAPLLVLNLPLAFGSILHGDYYGALFYLLIAIIVFCSLLLLLEPLTAWLQSAMLLPRALASCACAGLVWLLAVLITLPIADWSALNTESSPFEFFQLVSSLVLVPAVVLISGGLITALFRTQAYASRYSIWLRGLAHLHCWLVTPLLLAGIIWFAVEGRPLW